MTEIELMQVWQSRYGLLLPEYRNNFLESEITAEIIQFPDERIKVAVKKGDASLAGILAQLKTGQSPAIATHGTTTRKKKKSKQIATKNVSNSVGVIQQETRFMASDYYLVEPGAYKLGHIVYSIRRDKKTRILQAWLFDTQKGSYRRPFFSAEEHEILNKLKPTHRLTLRMAEKYSFDTGMCCHCGRTLTNMKSISRGMGPVCRSHYH
jgi:hypothetical protein